MTSRRAFLFGAATALAAPAVVRAEALMKLWVPPVKPLVMTAPQATEIGLAGETIYAGDLVVFTREAGKWVRAFHDDGRLRGVPEGVVIAQDAHGPVVSRHGFFTLPSNPPDGMQLTIKAWKPCDGILT